MAYSDGRHWFAAGYFATGYWAANFWASIGGVITAVSDGFMMLLNRRRR